MMEFALIKRQGLMLLTGEVGSGKTMLIQHFLTRIDDNYKVIRISQTQLSDVELFRLILLELDETANTNQNISALQKQIVERIEGCT